MAVCSESTRHMHICCQACIPPNRLNSAVDFVTACNVYVLVNSKRIDVKVLK